MFKIGSLLPHHSNRDNLGVGTGFFFIDQSIHSASARCPLLPKNCSNTQTNFFQNTSYRYPHNLSLCYRCVNLCHCVDRSHAIDRHLTNLKQVSRTFFSVHLKITQALNMAPPKTADYAALLKKLKKELIESTLASIDKKPKKDQETYYPTASQLQLLDVCGYKGYVVPLAFRSSIEANQFVDSYVLKKTKFLEQHNKMLAPWHSFFRIYKFIF